MSLGKNIAKQMYSLVENDKEALLDALAKLEEQEKVELAAVEEATEEVKEEEKALFASVKIADSEDSLYYADGDLTEGTPVFIDAEMSQPAADGDYALEGGAVISISEGVISSIEEPGNEEAPAEEEMAEEADLEGAVTLEAIVAEFAPIFEQFDARISALEQDKLAAEEAAKEAQEELEAEKVKVEKLSKQPAAQHFSGFRSEYKNNENKGFNTFSKFSAKLGTK